MAAIPRTVVARFVQALARSYCHATSSPPATVKKVAKATESMRNPSSPYWDGPSYARWIDRQVKSRGLRIERDEEFRKRVGPEYYTEREEKLKRAAEFVRRLEQGGKGS